ncbi:MAG: TIM barrel protein, partial [Nanoarchaeota archaeon]
YLVDKKTGEVIQTVRNDEFIYRPLYNEGNIIWKEEGIGLKEFKHTETGDIELKPVPWKEYVEIQKKKGIVDEGKIAKEFYKEQNAVQIRQAEGQAREYEAQYDQAKELYERTHQEYVKFKQLKDAIFENPDRSEEEKEKKWAILKESFKFQNQPFLPAQVLDPMQYLGKEQDRLKKVMESGQQTALAAQSRIDEAKKRLENTVPIEEYGKEQSAHNLAQAALYAYEVEKKQDLDKPLWIAPENWTPELYGSHPKEMKELIVDARKEMEKELIKKEVDPEDAKRIANDHIKGTFDIGHLNFWKKYYEGSDEDFKKWAVQNVKTLFEEGILGNVHISDNFGFHDEHLRPGEGNAPIKEFLKELEKAGYKGKIIAEPGGQKQGQFHTPWTSALGMNASPIYRTDTTSRAWTDIQGSYFGRTQAPSYIVGDFAPSKDWTLWSQVPLE